MIEQWLADGRMGSDCCLGLLGGGDKGLRRLRDRGSGGKASADAQMPIGLRVNAQASAQGFDALPQVFMGKVDIMRQPCPRLRALDLVAKLDLEGLRAGGMNLKLGAGAMLQGMAETLRDELVGARV